METVELRVHGVHGTSPGSMLGVSDSEVGQVAGDRLTGLYRAKDGRLPYRELNDIDVSVEAYSWGALTSGVQGFLGWVKRALWLLLLPFALVNLAYWARIDLARGTGQARWGARAVRMSGVLLTIFMVLSPCVVAIDMVAWQCYRYDVPGCTQLPGQLDFLASWTPEQRIAAASLVPMLVVLLLWLLSRKTLARYEQCNDPLDSPPELDGRPVLLHPKLWDGGDRTLRLQRLHLAAAVATVVGFTGWHARFAARDATPWLTATTVLAAVVIVVVLFLVNVNHPDDVDNVPPPARPGIVGRAETFGYAVGERVRALPASVDLGVLVAAALIYVAHFGALWLYGGRTDQSLDFYGHNLWFIGVFILLTALHLSVFVGSRGRTPAMVAVVVAAVFLGAAAATYLYSQDRFEGWLIVAALGVALLFWLALTLWHYLSARRRHRDKAWGGAGASVLLAAGAWIGLLFTSTAVIASADYLNGPDHNVADLVSTVERAGVVDPTTYNVDRLEARAIFVASGAVTLEDAHVTVVGGNVVVHAGTVKMESLSLEVPPERAGNEEFTEDRGPTIVDESATVLLPRDSVSLADSCLSRGGERCTAEDAQFHTAGVLRVPALRLVIDPLAQVVLEPSDVPEVPLVVPQVLIWTPIGQLVWVLLVLVAAVVCFLLFGFKVAPKIGRLLGADARSPDRDIPRRERQLCVKARTSAAFAHRAETVLDVIGAITAPVALVVLVMSMTGEPPWEFAAWTRNVATASMYLVIGMSAGLVLLGSQIRRSEQARKAVGVIWDLTTFWPRAAHPLGPPCYAERVIPELHTRLRWVLDKADATPNNVVISGHSQGSLIVTAMVSRLNPVHLGRLRVITYGSQIRALYGRVFPRVFGADAIGYRPTTGAPSLVDAFPDVPRPLGEVPGPPLPPEGSLRFRLAEQGGTWVNLFRRSDPLGYRVFSDLDSHLDIPVAEVPAMGVGDPGPVVQGHSGYQHSAAYRRRLHGWTGEPFVADPTGTCGLTPLPPA